MMTTLKIIWPALLCMTTPLYAAEPDPEAIKSASIPHTRNPVPGTFTGGQPSPTDFEILARAGIKHIINLRPDQELDWNEETVVTNLGMTYHHLPIAGAEDITFENAERLAAMVRQAGSSPMLIHCKSGNRVGALIALQASRDNGGDIEAALKKGREWGLTRLEAHIKSVLKTGKP